MEEYIRRVSEWLIRRAREAEAKDPAIRLLNDRINELQKEIMETFPFQEEDQDKLDPRLEEKRFRLLREQTETIRKLLDHTEVQ
jgi:hypothetical protein